MDKTALLKKIRALAEHGVGGEAENAEKLLARMMKKYGISEAELDEETRVRHDFTYHGGEEKKILKQVVYKVTGGYTYELVYTASGRKVRTQLGADCTPAEKVEIEYLFDFYKRLWEKEKDAFLAAYIQKHRIFAIRADIEPQEMSLEESIKRRNNTMSETSSRVRLMANLQAAVAEAVSGTMEERGRGFASDREAWAELKECIERTKQMHTDIEKVHKEMWSAVKDRNEDAFAALSQEFERSSRILAEEWAQTSALAKIAVISESND